MREGWMPQSSGHGFKKLDLHRRIGHMVIAPDDVRDFLGDVIDHGRQGVEVSAVLPQEKEVGERAPDINSEAGAPAGAGRALGRAHGRTVARVQRRMASRSCR